MIRYTVAFIGLLVGWISVAIVVGLLMNRLFPGPGTDHNVLGDWRSWPGSLLGVLAGYWLFRRVSEALRRKAGR